MARAGGSRNAASLARLLAACERGDVEGLRAVVQDFVHQLRASFGFADPSACVQHCPAHHNSSALTPGPCVSQVVRALLDGQNPAGQSGLHVAALHGRWSVVEELCKLGADPAITDAYDAGPLHYCCRHATPSPEVRAVGEGKGSGGRGSGGRGKKGGRRGGGPSWERGS